MESLIIDLIKNKSPQSRVFSGRSRGETVRRNLKLDDLDKRECIINIIIPKDTFSINNSFFLGLFGKSVRTLGEMNFRIKYKFDADQIVLANIEEGIERALKDRSIFDQKETSD